MTRLPAAEAKRLGLMPQKKSSKYRAQKVTIDGITFDSKKEARRYEELKLLKRAGKIRDFSLQPEYVLLDGFTYRGKRYQGIRYRGDFLVTYPDGREVVIDTKGVRTEAYRLKKKLLLARYPEINFVEE